MQLSTAQIQLILDELNSPERLKEFRRLTTPELRRDWKENENDALDTSGKELRRLHVEWMDGVLADLRRRHYPDMFVLTETTDFYFYTGTGKQAGPGRARLAAYSFVELPVQAFKIWQSVFQFSKTVKRWTERPWLGADKDPLLSLPYSRKYDRERAQAADRRETWQWEKLCRAEDLVRLLSGRVDALELSRRSWSSDLPKIETADILEALALDDLTIGQCEIGGYWHATEFEILRLVEQRHPRSGELEKRAQGPAVATGGYNGALNTIRYGASAATKKQVMLLALQQLWLKLDDICWPLTEDEEEARAELVERLTSEVDAATGAALERFRRELAARS